MTTLTREAPLIRRQFGLISLEQLADAGLTRAKIRTLVRHGRLRRVFPGVYAVEGAPRTPRQLAMAAVLACGEGAALSHVSAACHWRILDHWPSMPQVTIPGKGGQRGRRGIELHHSLRLQTTTHDHIPVTTLARTLNDIATHRAIKAAVRQAERLYRLDLPALDARGPLKRFLATYVSAADTDNDFEADFLELCARHGIPEPLRKQQVGPYWPDFLWPEHRLIVELDGRGSHLGHIPFSEDRERDRYLQLQGYVVLRFTYEDVRDRPAAVAAQIRAARSRSQARWAPAPPRA